MNRSIVIMLFLSVFVLALSACGSDPSQPPALTPDQSTQTTVTPNPHVANADCVTCHSEEHKRWSSTLHAASPAVVLLNPLHNTAEMLTDECLVCHAPFQAGKFHVGDFVQPIDQTGPWVLVEANQKEWQAIRCEVCHDPTSTAPMMLAFYDSAQAAYIPVQDTTEVCEKCHQPGTDDSHNLKGSVHDGIQCTICHFVTGSEMSLDSLQSCAKCHPKVSPSHLDVATLDTTFRSPDSPNDIHFINCSTCHPQGTPTPKP